MKLHENFGLTGFHTSIATTFCIDFEAYESVALSRLRAAGCNNNLVVADAGMLTQALETAVTLPPSLAASRYTATGARSPGVFHPKLLLQIGRERGRLLVGSANLTAPGLGGNFEVAGVVDTQTDDEASKSIVAAAWQYVRTHLDLSEIALSHQVGWMLGRAPWLEQSVAGKTPVMLDSGGSAMFLAGDGSAGLASRFADLIDQRPVRRLVCISPYWDNDLRALRGLADLLAAGRVAVVIGGSAPSFPGQAAGILDGLQLYDMEALLDLRKRRFVHAKVFVAQTDAADHVLFGSANCTTAALAERGFGWANDEACLYRRMAAGEAMKRLGLEAVLKKAARLDPADVQYRAGEQDTLSKKWLPRNPGRFEYVSGRLDWWPASGMAGGGATLELLATDRTPQLCLSTPLPAQQPGCCSYRLTELPAAATYARMRLDEVVSAPAPIVRLDVLRQLVREPHSPQVQRQIDRLEQHREEGLWLLEVFDLLASLEAQQIQGSHVGARPARPAAGVGAGAGAGEQVEYRTLTYAQFVANRRERGAIALTVRNDLVGSELGGVVRFLNQAIGLAASTLSVGSHEDQDATVSFESSLVEEELDDGADGPGSAPDTHNDAANAPKRRQTTSFDPAVSLAVANRDKIAAAVNQATQSLRASPSSVNLSVHDLVRLRIVILVVLVAARPSDGQTTMPAQQVLSATVRPEWPRLVGSLLSAMFGGEKAAIRRLQIDPTEGGWPTELIHCWACCAWSINAARQALEGQKRSSKLAKLLDTLRPSVYRAFELQPEQLADEEFMRIYASMSNRFAVRLKLDQTQLDHMHRVELERLTVRRAALPMSSVSV
ncbi:hypothetical protein [Lysobacter capsici]|uniref:hypothetical protein n=1 Tax=Lysobacter capsici TaxID=435897 RepID=UPI0006277670|nr:hypothetical protein [Lysobacter capsici]